MPQVTSAVKPHAQAPFERLGRLAVRVLDVPMAFVAVVGGAAPFLSVQSGSTFPPAGEQQAAAGLAFTRRLAASGAVVAVADVLADPSLRRDPWLQAMGLRAVAVCALRGPGGEVLGSLCVADVCARTWTQDDLEVLAALAETAASKATLREDARRSEETAALLQHSMLTDLPQFDHLELVARYLPAQNTAQIGGDWYDAFLLPDGMAALVVGDVAGHDMTAAAKMGQLRNLLRGIAWHGNAAPHSVLSALDRTAYGLDVAELATVIYARVEPVPVGSWQVRWANAGHPPPLRISTADGARYLDEPAGVLLAFGDAQHADGVIELAPGTTLLLYTDGLIESRHVDLHDGLERLRAAAATAAGWPLAALCDHVLSDVVGGTNEDDVTLLAVRLASEPAGREARTGP